MKIWALIFLPVVRAIIKGYNHYGLETPHQGFTCDWVHQPEYYMDELVKLGFNSVRVPFSREWVNAGDFSKLDSYLEHAKRYPNFTVLLDLHRTFSSHQGEIYEGGVSLTDYANTWITMAKRYENNPQVTALDLYNEPQSNDYLLVNSFYKELVTKIESAVPNRYFYWMGCPQWGGNCHYMNYTDLSFHDRVGITIHRYSFSGGQTIANWDWAFDDWRPVMIGEWSWKNDDPSQRQWVFRFIEYLRNKGIRDGYFWTIANSGDTGNLWNDGCDVFDWDKFNIIKTLWDNRRLRGSV